MKTIGKITCSFLLTFFLPIPVAIASISIPGIFADNMVLQRNSEILLWGWAKAGETITISTGWNGNEITFSVGNQGKWKTTLSTPDAGGPYTIKLKGYNEIVLKNVMIGEVWLVSGQSNMEWSARSGIFNAEEEIKTAEYPGIRFFTVYHGTSLYPQDRLGGEWSVCSPESMQYFSAIGYFFARKIHAELGIPVGIINTSWGGTPAEAWIPEETIIEDSFLREAAAKQEPVPWGPVETARIYNSMVAPLIPYHIAGVLWYQGEANTINSYAYKEILTALIKSWRLKWGYNFPFYYAQIAPFRYGRPHEGAEVRDAQRRVLRVPGTGMAVLSDIGDTIDIHPKNKQDAALRLANLALNRYYGKTRTEDSGPLFREMKVEKNKVFISFDHAEGLFCKGKKLTCFEIAGEDKVFYRADAVIKDGLVIVSSKSVKLPSVVRFAWDNTATPNLFNGAGLPASTFTTE